MMIYDVAIIGAGPSGAMLAKSLAEKKSNLKILLVDGQSEKRRKPCGGLLAPDAQKLLAKLNLTLPKSVLADPQIFAVETIDLQTKYVRCYQRHYLNMDRLAFDRWLVSMIPDSVDIVNGRCTSVEKTDDTYKISMCSDGASTEFYSASLVGADGGGSIVRRSFFDNVKIYKYISIQQWFEKEDEKLPPYSCIFDRKTSDSCSWTIRKSGYTVFGGAFKRASCKEAFERQKSRLEAFLNYKFGSAVKTEACLLTSPRSGRDFILGRDGIYLVGEAAGFISASSFEGISSAILSGILLAQSLSDGKNKNAVLRLYKRKTRALRLKLCLKMLKRRILCSPILRKIIMKSGICSVERFDG